MAVGNKATKHLLKKQKKQRNNNNKQHRLEPSQTILPAFCCRVTATQKKTAERANQEPNLESSNPESDTLSIVLLALHSQGPVLSKVLCHRPELYFAIVHFIERPTGRQAASQPASQPALPWWSSG